MTDKIFAKAALTLLILATSLTAGSQTEEKISGYSCSACHVPEDWSIIRMTAFDHDSTAFPLTDAHAHTACAACHTGKTIKERHSFDQAGTACNGCHTDFHETLLGTACEKCHSPISWQDAGSTFDHDKTLFPMIGSHIGLPCESCHFDYSSGNLSGLEPDCGNCHQSAKARADMLNPDHALFTSDCEKCHAVFSWADFSFDHALTSFPLTGKHTATDCVLCHESGYTDTPDRCDICHMEQYNNTTSPEHDSEIYLANDCELCHDTESFETSFYAHLPEPSVCNLCHLTHLNSANQTVAGHDELPNDCTVCHTTSDWTELIFNHDVAGFPLEGVHLTMPCEGCHTDAFLNTPAECVDCHLTDLNSANQIVAGHDSLPNDCSICHSASDWTELTFSHDAAGFPLEGIHLTTPCEGCHTDGYLNTPSECVDCHLAQYEQTTQPPHSELGFLPENCDLCHTALGWTPASFDHENIATGCTDCHSTDGAWDPLPAIDHDSSPKLGPDMQDCIVCHANTSSWLAVSFSNGRHDGNLNEIYFDIYSGEHNGEWSSSCTDNCHVFGAFDTYSCYDNCHTNKHSRSKMVDEHCEGGGNCSSCIGTNGYWPVSLQYSDGDWGIPETFTQCYTCHPDGSKSGACGDEGDRIQPIGNYFENKVKKRKENKGNIK